MSRLTHILTATVLALGLSAAGVTAAAAQEMEHGRTRPSTSAYTVWR